MAGALMPVSSSHVQPKRLEIRKYPNRRYYDATRGGHLTLDDIRTLIREGYDLRVTDSKSGADITAQVLTQVILELETPKVDLFPIPVLVRMIRLNDRFIKDFVGQTLISMLDQQQQLEQRLRTSHALPPVFAPFAAWSRAFLEPLTGADDSREPGTTPSPPAAPAPASQGDGAENLRARIDQLQKEVNGLERQLSAKRRVGAPKRKRRPRARRQGIA